MQCTRTTTLGIILLELLHFVDFHTSIYSENFLQKCNLLWTITSTCFKFGAKAHSGALVTFCDKALVLSKRFSSETKPSLLIFHDIWNIYICVTGVIASASVDVSVLIQISFEFRYSDSVYG